MRKILLFLVSCLAMNVYAQEDVATFNKANYVYFGSIKSSEHNSLGSILVGALQQKAIAQDRSCLPDLKAGIVRGLANVVRISMKEECNEQSMQEFAKTTDARCFVADCVVKDIGTFVDFSNNISKQAIKGVVTFTLNLKDIKTNTIFASREFSDEYAVYYEATPAKAMAGAISYATGDVWKTFSSIFPVRGSIVQNGDAKNDKQKEVYINLGKHWTFVNQAFGVFTLQTIAGKEAKHYIGKLKVVEVMGDDISRCKVSKGGSDIKKYLDQGTVLTVESE